MDKPSVLGTPLERARVALITTAAPFQPGVGYQGPGAPYNAAAIVLAPQPHLPAVLDQQLAQDRAMALVLALAVAADREVRLVG
jgi:hypothetical protein